MNLVEVLKENGRKYTAKYVEKFGSDELIGTWEIPAQFMKKGTEKGIEEFYKYCLEQGKKARNIVKVSKGDIL